VADYVILIYDCILIGRYDANTSIESVMSSLSSPVSLNGPGRKPVISRDHIIAATLALLGPNRSLSTLSLREVARAAGIAPNSFYRQFRDMDELAVALIDLAGHSLRQIIGKARIKASSGRSVVKASIEVFMDQLRADDGLLHLLLREGTIGSPAYQQAVERQLVFFEAELKHDLTQLAQVHGTGLFEPALTARAITRLVFAMGAKAISLGEDEKKQLTKQTITMVRIIIAGTQALDKQQAAPAGRID
jgi:TetR/AcrR family transcriptional regulator, fatty acid biosynthesis regulator